MESDILPPVSIFRIGPPGSCRRHCRKERARNTGGAFFQTVLHPQKRTCRPLLIRRKDCLPDKGRFHGGRTQSRPAQVKTEPRNCRPGFRYDRARGSDPAIRRKSERQTGSSHLCRVSPQRLQTGRAVSYLYCLKRLRSSRCQKPFRFHSRRQFLSHRRRRCLFLSGKLPARRLSHILFPPRRSPGAGASRLSPHTQQAVMFSQPRSAVFFAESPAEGCTPLLRAEELL